MWKMSESVKTETTVEKPQDFRRTMQDIFASSGMLIAAAVALALLISALLVVFFNPEVQKTFSYFFAKPSDFFAKAGAVFVSFFTSLFRGAIFDYHGDSFIAMIKPITDSITRSTPLILAGLSVAVAFRAGLFNIGAQGQMLIGAMMGTYIGIAFQLPFGLHLLVAMFAAIVGGAIWGGIPGFLKAKVGANEVIVTIMLNSIALFLLSYVLKSRTFIGGGYAGKSLQVPDTASYPKILGSFFNLHAGFIVAIFATLFVWWLLERSIFGFELRAAGANPSAAVTAGINVNRVILATMVISGALAGLAGTAPVIGTDKFLSTGVAGSVGFDAITVALLGGSTPLGTLLAGILFGAFAAGGATMQAAANIPVDIVTVSQAVIVLLIAAPPLIRFIFRLPDPKVLAQERNIKNRREGASK